MGEWSLSTRSTRVPPSMTSSVCPALRATSSTEKVFFMSDSVSPQITSKRLSPLWDSVLLSGTPPWTCPLHISPGNLNIRHLLVPLVTCPFLFVSNLHEHSHVSSEPGTCVVPHIPPPSPHPLSICQALPPKYPPFIPSSSALRESSRPLLIIIIRNIYK